MECESNVKTSPSIGLTQVMGNSSCMILREKSHLSSHGIVVNSG